MCFNGHKLPHELSSGGWGDLDKYCKRLVPDVIQWTQTTPWVVVWGWGIWISIVKGLCRICFSGRKLPHGLSSGVFGDLDKYCQRLVLHVLQWTQITPWVVIWRGDILINTFKGLYCMCFNGRKLLHGLSSGDGGIWINISKGLYRMCFNGRKLPHGLLSGGGGHFDKYF